MEGGALTLTHIFFLSRVHILSLTYINTSQGFEHSDSCRRFLRSLHARGYEVLQCVLSPTMVRNRLV